MSVKQANSSKKSITQLKGANKPRPKSVKTSGKSAKSPLPKNPNPTLRSSSLTRASQVKRKTQILVKYDAGFSNNLYIRGEGANLNWKKGIELKNINKDEWVWETSNDFNSCSFKILINDEQFEIGENHAINCGKSIQLTPLF